MTDRLSSEDNVLPKLQASWANRGWVSCVADILARLQDESVMKRLNLHICHADDDSKAEQTSKAELLTNLIIRTAANRAWTSSVWSEIPPENWTGVLSTNQQDAQEALHRMHSDAQEVKAALAASRQAGHPERQARTPVQTYSPHLLVVFLLLSLLFLVTQGLASAFEHLWFHRLTLVQETWQACAGSRKRRCAKLTGQLRAFKETWDHCDHFAWSPAACFAHIHYLGTGLISTKDVLEDCIGEMKDISTRDQKRATGQQPERTFFYGTVSGRIRHLRHVTLNKGDYMSKEFRTASAHRDAVFSQKNPVQKEGVLARLKELCRQGTWLATSKFFPPAYIVS